MKKRMSITAGLLLFISMSITSFANEKLDDFSSDTTLTQIESENYAEEYMTSNGYWTSVTYNVLQKGDIVKFSNISHVVMITLFDGVSYGYSGHTSDRRNCVMTFSNSTGKYYRVG